MDELTRRHLLAGVSGLFGVTAGCQSLGDQPSDTSQTETQEGALDGDIYVRASPSELPDAPSSPSFGVTGTGVYRFRGPDAGWRHIRLGSTDRQVPQLDATEVTIGASPTNRPLISNSNRTLYVDPNRGDDAAAGTKDDPLATIQQAVYRVPIYLRHQYTIDLATVPETPVTYEEDILVPAIIGTGQAGLEKNAPQAGPVKNLVLKGGATPDQVELGSIMFANVCGTSTGHLLYVTITRDSPYDDENHGLSAYGTGEVHLFDIAFTDGPTRGVLAYGSKMKATRIDVGSGNLDVAVRAKRHGSIIAREVEGEVSGAAFRAGPASKISVNDENSVTGTPQYRAPDGGLIYIEQSDTWVGLGSSMESKSQTGSVTQNDTTRTAHPESAATGEIWYVDGSEETEEGFYGQTNDGPVRLG